MKTFNESLVKFDNNFFPIKEVFNKQISQLDGKERINLRLVYCPHSKYESLAQLSLLRDWSIVRTPCVSFTKNLETEKINMVRIRVLKRVDDYGSRSSSTFYMGGRALVLKFNLFSDFELTAGWMIDNTKQIIDFLDRGFQITPVSDLKINESQKGNIQLKRPILSSNGDDLILELTYFRKLKVYSFPFDLI